MLKKLDDFELFPNLNSKCTSLGDVNWFFLATEKATKAFFLLKIETAIFKVLNA